MTEPAKQPAAVPVQAPDGSIGTVAPEQLAQALDAGAQVVAPEVLHQAQVQQKYGGVGGMAGAAAAGAARGLTFGLSDEAAVGLGGEDTRETLAGLKEANPWTSAGSELAGAIAPMVFTGGAGAAVEGAELARAGLGAARTAEEGLTLGRTIRGLGALPRAVSELGGVAERGVGALAGDGVIGRGLAMGARGATEGAFYGAGNEVSEAALGDHELTAEKLLAGAKQGAIFGGVSGGLLGAAGEAATARLARKADYMASPGSALTDAIEEAVPSAATTPGAVDSVAHAYIDRVAKDPDQAELLRKAWSRRADVFGKHEDLLEDATRKVTEHLDAAIKAERTVDMATFGASKEGQMAKLVDGANWRQARDAALGVWKDSKSVIDELLADPTRGGSGVAVNRASKWLEKFGNELGEVATAKNKGDVAKQLFTQLDDFKRAMADGAQFGRGPFGLPEASKEFDGLYHRIRGVLEDEGVWGKAGTAQREINEAAQARFATRRQFGSTFTTQYGSEAGRPLYVANPEGAASYVNGLTSAKNDLKHRALLDYIHNEERFLSAVEKHYDVAGQAKDIASARKALAGLRETVHSTEQEVTTVNRLKKLHAVEREGGVGGLVGLAADAAMRPLTTLERAAAIERRTTAVTSKLGLVQKQAGRTDGEIGNSLKQFFTKSPHELVAKSAGAAVRKGESLREQYAKKTAEIAAMSTNPNAVHENIAASLGDLHQYAPGTAAALAAKSSATVAYLATKIPKGHIDPNSLTPHLETPKVSDMERDTFMRHVRGTDARAVADDLAHGRLARESVEAFRATSPKLYAQVTAVIQQELGTLKEPLPYQKELQLRILLGKPTPDPSFLKKLQSTFAENDNAKDNDKGAAPVPFKLTTDERPESERVEEK